MNLELLNDDELLRLWRQTQALLRQRGVCRSANVVGSVAESLVAEKLQLSLAAPSMRGHDAIAPDGTLFQIKARLMTVGNPSRQLGDVHYLHEERPFDFLIAVQDLSPLFGAAVTTSATTSGARRIVRPGANSFSVNAAGRDWLLAQLTRAGFSASVGPGKLFTVATDGASPRLVRVIAARQRIFSLRPTLNTLPNLLLIYLWYVDDPAKTVAYALTYQQALAIANKKGWTNTPSWLNDGYYYDSHVGDELLALLAPYPVQAGQWQEVIAGTNRG